MYCVSKKWNEREQTKGRKQRNKNQQKNKKCFLLLSHTHVYILTRHYTNTTLLKAFFTAPSLLFPSLSSALVFLFAVSQYFCLFRWCFVADFVFCENNVHIKNQIFCVTFSPWNVFCAHEQSIGMASRKPNHRIIFKHTLSLSLSFLSKSAIFFSIFCFCFCFCVIFSFFRVQ